MKKTFGIVFIIFLVFLCLGCIEYNVYQCLFYKNESNKVLKQAYLMLENSNNINSEDNKKMVYENSEDEIVYTENKNEEKNISQNDILGILKIPKINVEAPVKDGTSQLVMKLCVGHFIESDYWEGNIAFASHNSGTSAHYFEKIKFLNEGDEIEYITKLGSKKYKINKICKIKSTDWSMIEEKTNENTITLVTCINKEPNYRLCVRGVEIL